MALDSNLTDFLVLEYKLVTLVPAHAPSLEVSVQKKAFDHSQLHSPTEKYGRLELICNFSTGRQQFQPVENRLGRF